MYRGREDFISKKRRVRSCLAEGFLSHCLKKSAREKSASSDNLVARAILMQQRYPCHRLFLLFVRLHRYI